VVPNVVKVATQIKIYDARLALNDRLGYAVNCFMSCLLGAVPKRSRLEVSLKDRLQDELKRTLHHPVTDRRHGRIELHLVPANFWGRSRSLPPFIPSAVRSLAS